jgi:hypothetical protein
MKNADLASILQGERDRVAAYAKSAGRLPGMRARQAFGELEGAVAAIERARGYLLASSSGFFEKTPDPRREPE